MFLKLSLGAQQCANMSYLISWNIPFSISRFLLNSILVFLSNFEIVFYFCLEWSELWALGKWFRDKKVYVFGRLLGTSKCANTYVMLNFMEHYLFVFQISSRISLKLWDCLRRTLVCTVFLLGMIRAMNTQVLTPVNFTVWRPCRALDGFWRGPFTKKS